MRRKIIFYAVVLLAITSCSQAKVSVSDKKFPPISLLNHFEYFSGRHEFNQLGTAFLLKYKNDTFAITAKHTLAILKTESSKNLSLENFIKKWTMSPLNKKDEEVVVDQLLNEDKHESLQSKSLYEKDWLAFSIKENRANVVPLEFRDKPLVEGEKLYVVGWTRHMQEGDQRVYEFEYYQTKGTHLLLKKIIIPEKMGGLSGGPVVDKDCKLAGIVSNSEFSFFTMEKLLTAVGTVGLKEFLDNYQEQSKKK